MDKNLLPIRRYENEIVRAVKENPVVVILGETGSGKTTQIAQIVYEHIDEILSTDDNNNRNETKTKTTRKMETRIGGMKDGKEKKDKEEEED